MRRYLLAYYTGGAVELTEVSEDNAVNSITEVISLKDRTRELLLNANNGTRFRTWYGEDVIVVLVDK